MTELEYHPPLRFKTLAETETAKGIWAYLTAPETVFAMEVAATLNAPPVSILYRIYSEQDAATNDAECLEDEYKRLTGSMIRQVMEAKGWEIIRDSHGKAQQFETHGDCDFKTGARYTRQSWGATLRFNSGWEKLEKQQDPLARSREFHAKHLAEKAKRASFNAEWFKPGSHHLTEQGVAFLKGLYFEGCTAMSAAQRMGITYAPVHRRFSEWRSAA